MLKFVIRRLSMLVLTLLVASFAIYASLSIAPGDPLSVLTGGRTLPPEALGVLRARYHLDEGLLPQYWHWLTNALTRAPSPPGGGLPPQYWHWLTNAITGARGDSTALREPVNTVIKERAGVT